MLNDAAKKLIERAARAAARDSQDRARLGASTDALLAEAWRDATTQNPDFGKWTDAEGYFETIFIRAIDA